MNQFPFKRCRFAECVGQTDERAEREASPPSCNESPDQGEDNRALGFDKNRVMGRKEILLADLRSDEVVGDAIGDGRKRGKDDEEREIFPTARSGHRLKQFRPERRQVENGGKY